MDTNTRWDIAEVYYYYYYYYYTMDLASINFASYNPSSYGFLKLIELLILFKFFYLYYYLRRWWAQERKILCVSQKNNSYKAPKKIQYSGVECLVRVCKAN